MNYRENKNGCWDLGFHQLRVRIYGNIARIELIPEEFARFIADEVCLPCTSA